MIQRIIMPFILIAPAVKGKHFHAVKSAFRPSKGLSTFAKRMGTKREYDEMRQRERTMAESLELERQV